MQGRNGSLAIVASDQGPYGLTQRIAIASDAPWRAASRHCVFGLSLNRSALAAQFHRLSLVKILYP